MFPGRRPDLLGVCLRSPHPRSRLGSRPARAGGSGTPEAEGDESSKLGGDPEGDERRGDADARRIITDGDDECRYEEPRLGRPVGSREAKEESLRRDYGVLKCLLFGGMEWPNRRPRADLRLRGRRAA
jgi:hypothetical protein